MTTTTPIDLAPLRASLETKKAILERARAELKTEFFGIDKAIDAIIESIQTWYLLPDIVTRPIICSLFSLTGCGKTALVRSLAAKLGFSNRFVEIQMDGYSNGAYGEPKSICEILESSSIEEGSAGIIFLDEFQRFRSVDKDGSDVKLERYQDVWMLLSDGRFSSDYSFLSKIESELAYSEYMEDEEAAWDAERATKQQTPSTPVEAATVKYKRKYTLYPYQAKTFKKLLRLKEPVTEIMTWTKQKVRDMVRDYAKTNTNSSIDYTKCLVFVAGNMDEAFRMSGDVDDCDTNADVFHEYTKKIGPIEIKAALTQRFKPEQIARLGNNLIVYPSLTREAYERIIRRACQHYIEQARKVCGVAFVISEGVYQEIYENSVYPTQGTRPVFTSIHKMFGSPLSDGIMWALELGVDKVGIDLSVPNSSLIFTHDDKKKAIKIDLDIRARRASRSDDFTALVAVHEAGHAILYAVLFKTVPMEVCINVASFRGGYNLLKDSDLSKRDVLDRVAVKMGGIIAEELIFGQELRSTGCGSDIASATSLAAQYVRQWAMDGYVSNITVYTDVTAPYRDIRALESSPAIEAIIQEQKERAQSILTQHRALLVDLSNQLLKVKKLDAGSAYDFMKDRIDGLAPLETTKDVNGDYAARLVRAGCSCP